MADELCGTGARVDDDLSFDVSNVELARCGSCRDDDG